MNMIYIGLQSWVVVEEIVSIINLDRPIDESYFSVPTFDRPFPKALIILRNGKSIPSYNHSGILLKRLAALSKTLRGS